MLEEDYEQNGVDKKRSRVRLNRLGGRKMGELCGGREAEIGRSLKNKRVQEHGSKRPREKSTKITFHFHRFRPQSRKNEISDISLGQKCVIQM